MPIDEKSDNNEIMNRQDYTRVTTILYPFSGLKDVDPDILANAANRGTKVHNICEAIIRGFGEIGVEDETWGYVESFKQWWNAQTHSESHGVIDIEKRFFNDELQLTGQVDLILNTHTGIAIIDFKTSSRPSKTWAAQGAAYAMLAKQAGYDIKHVYFLHLNKHGKEATIHEYPIDDAFFLAILRTYQHFYKE